MNVPFFDIKQQYQQLKHEIEVEISGLLENCAYIGGDYLTNFERQAAEYLSAKHAMGCSSGTSALILALRACNVRPGDEVITTPFTFFATAEAIACIGAIPVFVDVRQDDYNIDPDKIEHAITKKTRAILPVHIFGAPCDMDSINRIARNHGLKVIEDCSQAIGSSYKGRMAGTLGDVGCFSFYPTKNLGGCGDGGMVTVNDDDLYAVLLALHEHGAGRNGAKAARLLNGAVNDPISAESSTEWYDPYKYFNYLIGYNARLDAVQACVLSIKLKRLDQFNANRARIAHAYMNGLTERLRQPVYRTDTRPCWHQFVVRSAYKRELCDYLHDHGVGSGTFYPVPLHRQKAFDAGNSRVAGNGDSLPVAEEISAQSVCLPMFPELTDGQIFHVINTVNRFYEERT